MDTTRNNYVATAKEIEALVLQRIEDGNAFSMARTTYLRALIATTQDKLGIRSKSLAAVSEEAMSNQLVALEETHTAFYAAVQAAAKRGAIDPEDSRDRDTILASRIVFARTAYSTVRAWMVRGKHSLAAVVAAKATKRGLFEATPARRVERGKSKLKTAPLMRSAQAILDKIVESGRDDKEAGIMALQEVLTLLTHGFDKLGMSAVAIRDAVEHTATDVLHPEFVSKALRPRKKAA